MYQIVMAGNNPEDIPAILKIRVFFNKKRIWNLKILSIFFVGNYEFSLKYIIGIFVIMFRYQ